MDTLDRLRSLLDQGHALTYADASARLGVSDRQIRRHFRQLATDGVPVQRDFDGPVARFSIPPSHQRATLDGLAFDEAEVRALTIAAEAARSALAGTPHEAPLARAFGRRPQSHLLALKAPACFSTPRPTTPHQSHLLALKVGGVGYRAC